MTPLARFPQENRSTASTRTATTLMDNIRYATPREQTANRRPQVKRVVDDDDEWDDT